MIVNCFSRGAMLIECDGNDASQRMCFSVVNPKACVNSQYVRTVANLYNKEWAADYPNSSRRIMLDSSFSVRSILDNLTILIHN